jgi:hypothetical protein
VKKKNMKNEDLKGENPLGDFGIDVLRAKYNLSFAEQSIH